MNGAAITIRGHVIYLSPCFQFSWSHTWECVNGFYLQSAVGGHIPSHFGLRLCPQGHGTQAEGKSLSQTLPLTTQASSKHLEGLPASPDPQRQGGGFSDVIVLEFCACVW